jgi:hypothetical protein
MHRVAYLGFVSRPVMSCRHDTEAAVKSEVVLSRVQIRIVAVRLGHAGLGIIGNG